MKKIIISIVLSFICSSSCFASHAFTPSEKKNISLVKQMFSEMLEKRDISQFDKFHTKDFKFSKNHIDYNYQEYKDIQRNLYENLASAKVRHYDDIFAKGNKVTARMQLEVVNKQGLKQRYKAIVVAKVRDNKVARVWEVVSPVNAKA